MKKIFSVSELGITNSSRIAIWMPHPIAESEFTSGIILQSLEIGADVLLYIVSAGESSTKRNGLKPDEDLGVVRSLELQNAAKVLGLSKYRLFQYPDGKFKLHADQIQKVIKSEIISYNPTIVLTLEPNGIYGHPDHITLSKLVESEVCSDQKLYYLTVPTNTPSTGSHLAEKPVIPSTPDYMLTLSDRLREIKIQALACYHSQCDPEKLKTGGSEFFKANKILDYEYITVGQ